MCLAFQGGFESKRTILGKVCRRARRWRQSGCSAHSSVNDSPVYAIAKTCSEMWAVHRWLNFDLGGGRRYVHGATRRQRHLLQAVDAITNIPCVALNHPTVTASSAFRHLGDHNPWLDVRGRQRKIPPCVRAAAGPTIGSSRRASSLMLNLWLNHLSWRDPRKYEIEWWLGQGGRLTIVPLWSMKMYCSFYAGH